MNKIFEVFNIEICFLGSSNLFAPRVKSWSESFEEKKVFLRLPIINMIAPCIFYSLQLSNIYTQILDSHSGVKVSIGDMS